jgi:hypothetical protein
LRIQCRGSMDWYSESAFHRRSVAAGSISSPVGLWVFSARSASLSRNGVRGSEDRISPDNALTSFDPFPPIAGSTASMGNSDDLHAGGCLPKDDQERKPPHDQPARSEFIHRISMRVLDYLAAECSSSSRNISAARLLRCAYRSIAASASASFRATGWTRRRLPFTSPACLEGGGVRKAT